MGAVLAKKKRAGVLRFEPGGTIVNQVKDLDAVLDVAGTSGLSLPLTS